MGTSNTTLQLKIGNLYWTSRGKTMLLNEDDEIFIPSNQVVMVLDEPTHNSFTHKTRIKLLYLDKVGYVEISNLVSSISDYLQEVDK